MTGADLQESKIKYRMGRVDFKKLDRAITTDQTSGSVKLLAGADGKILGGHILGANAGDLIAPVVYLMRFGLTVKMMVKRCCRIQRWRKRCGGCCSTLSIVPSTQ